jgi:hypothetical protein
MYYFEVPAAEQRRRIDQRQADEPHTTWPMSDEELAEWACIMQVPTQGELDGSEPIDDPPAGFASWDEWRGHRWSRWPGHAGACGVLGAVAAVHGLVEKGRYL